MPKEYKTIKRNSQANYTSLYKESYLKKYSVSTRSARINIRFKITHSNVIFPVHHIPLHSMFHMLIKVAYVYHVSKVALICLILSPRYAVKHISSRLIRGNKIPITCVLKFKYYDIFCNMEIIENDGYGMFRVDCRMDNKITFYSFNNEKAAILYSFISIIPIAVSIYMILCDFYMTSHGCIIM